MVIIECSMSSLELFGICESFYTFEWLSWFEFSRSQHHNRGFQCITRVAKIIPVHVRASRDLCGWKMSIEVGIMAVLVPPGSMILIATVSTFQVIIPIFCWELLTIMRSITNVHQTVTCKYKEHQYKTCKNEDNCSPRKSYVRIKPILHLLRQASDIVTVFKGISMALNELAVCVGILNHSYYDSAVGCVENFHSHGTKEKLPLL